MMKTTFIVLCVIALTSVPTLAQQSLWAVDFVKIKAEKYKEARFFYDNNWKKYREAALKKGYIRSFQFLMTESDTTAPFHIILMTEYQDSSQYYLAEYRFQQIIKEYSPNGATLLNNIKPSDFRQNVMFKIFYGESPEKKGQ